jgi:Tfp pilus assembly protein FimT
MGQKNRGFSLVEALFVLVLLIVVAAISLPLLNRSTSYARIRSDAYDIAGKLTQAKFRAATELTPVRVKFNLASNSYQLERRVGGTFTPDGSALSLRTGVSYAGSGVLSSFTVAPADGEQVLPATQSLSIVFNSRGIPIDTLGQPLADNAIYLGNDKEDYFAITVSLAGLVEVWRYLPDGTWAPPQ